MGRKKFDEEKKKLTLELYNQGLTQKQVGAKMSISQSWVSCLLNAEGVKSRPRRIEKNVGEDFVKLYNMGKNLDEIADLHNVCIMSVRNHLKANNIKMPKGRPDEDEIDLMQELSEQDMSTWKIAKEMKRDRRTVRKYLNERGNNNVNE